MTHSELLTAIRAEAKEKGITAWRVAKDTGNSAPTIQCIFNGRTKNPSARVVFDLMHYFCYDVARKGEDPKH